MSKARAIMKGIVQRTGFAVAAASLCVVAIAGSAFAYFTDYVEANGSKAIDLEYSTTTNEHLEGYDKHITMKNTGTTDVFVRVQLFYGSAPNIKIEEPQGTGWSQDPNDEHIWVYEKVLAPKDQPGDTTEELVVKVTAEETIQDFNIIVIGQTSPVVYDENNEPQPSIWSDDRSDQN